MKSVIFLLLFAALAGLSGCGDAKMNTSAHPATRYQCSMHPWVQSEAPGKCTVCGMDLVPMISGADAHGASTHTVLLPEGAPQVASVRTQPIAREKLTRTLRFAGTIEDDDSRHRIISAYTAGRLEKLFVNYDGAEVEAGQPLALFYSRELLAAAREYALARKQNNAPIAALGATRLQQLGLTPEQIAKVPDRAENDSFFEILAPITGTVVKRVAYEGQYVAEGEKLMEIADFSTMWLQFSVYEQDLPFLRVGQTVNVTLPSLPGKTLTAPITFINPNLDEATRSVKVRANIPNPDSNTGLHQRHELLHQTFAQAEVLAELPEVLTVPRSAVLWPGEKPRVYVERKPGSYEQRAVVLGRPGDDTWEVLDGLSEGERVVVSGNMLIDGQAQIDRLGDPLPASKMSEQSPQRTYLNAVAALSETLSQDDLESYRADLARLPGAPAGFPKTAPTVGNDLAAARLDFQPFSAAVVAAAQKIRSDVPDLKIFRCPMSNLGGSGLPKNAEWVQFSQNIHNPFLGKDMLDCGTEIPAP